MEIFPAYFLNFFDFIKKSQNRALTQTYVQLSTLPNLASVGNTLTCKKARMEMTLRLARAVLAIRIRGRNEGNGEEIAEMRARGLQAK